MYCFKNLHSQKVIVSITLIVSLWLGSCSQPQQNDIQEEKIDLAQIIQKGSLVVAICDNPIYYSLHKGEPRGFQYEVLSELGKHLGVKVEFIVGTSFTDNLQLLADGQCDMIASDLLIPEDYQSIAVNCDTLYIANQILVQRKPEKWRNMSVATLESNLVRDPQMLNGKMVYTSGWSSIEDESNLLPELRIRMTNMKGVSPEILINLVKEGELDYVVCEQAIAGLIASRTPDLDIQTVLGTLPVGWVVRLSSTELHNEINQWMAGFKKTSKYAILYRKYLENNALQANRAGTISAYDNLFKKHSEKIDWDWRLLASLVCQESRFNPVAESKRGAYGLMQMMPTNMERYGLDDSSSPEKQISAGVAYIKYLDNLIAESVPDKEERIKFVLASYNIGPGHILDAQRLAKKYGKDAEIWDDNVNEFLLNKSKPEYYNDPEVRHGRCVGKETSAFVVQIFDRYEHYKNIVKL